MIHLALMIVAFFIVGSFFMGIISAFGEEGGCLGVIIGIIICIIILCVAL